MISAEDFRIWLNEMNLTYAKSHRERKRMVVNLRGDIVITVSGKTEWIGTDIDNAVDAYNNITEKYVDPLKDFKI